MFLIGSEVIYEEKKGEIMKKVLLVSFCLVLVFCLFGCSNNEVSQDETSTESQDAAIQIESIDWKVEESVVDGDRQIAFSYINNSDYPIVKMSISFKIKDGYDLEDLKTLYSNVLEYGLSDDELSELVLTADSNVVTNPGDTSAASPCLLGILYVENMDQYNAMEPDLMTIQYLDGNSLKTEYYDFRNSSYSSDSEVIDVTQWADNDLSSMISKPENGLIISVNSYSNQFAFDVIDFTSQEFQAYADDCANKGFSQNVVSTDTSYYADNSDGTLQLQLIYFSNEQRLSAYLNKVG